MEVIRFPYREIIDLKLPKLNKKLFKKVKLYYENI